MPRNFIGKARSVNLIWLLKIKNKKCFTYDELSNKLFFLNHLKGTLIFTYPGSLPRFPDGIYRI